MHPDQHKREGGVHRRRVSNKLCVRGNLGIYHESPLLFVCFYYVKQNCRLINPDVVGLVLIFSSSHRANLHRDGVRAGIGGGFHDRGHLLRHGARAL